MQDGRINPAMLQAQQRGVIFDVGHGGAASGFACTAILTGIRPNSISTILP